jgi:hypothetical protein
VRVAARCRRPEAGGAARPSATWARWQLINGSPIGDLTHHVPGL